ncbi:MAG: AMP-binding protein, partial [Gammaproteobacteria bacterium]|nr:AMP-binding protein [Gammaproteobacteria bacterium]
MTHTQQSYVHRGGDEPLLGATIPEHFAEIVKRFPDHEAVVSLPQKRRLTYQQLAEAIDQLARGLLAQGFKPGDRIGIWSTNNIEWLLVQMATARIGVILVNINPAYRSKELAYALQRSEVQGLFVIPAFRKSDYVSILLELMPSLKDCACDELACKDFEQLRCIVIYDPENPDQTQEPYSGFTSWQKIIDKAESITTEALDEITTTLDHDDPINIQYTSGTTGFPKPVLLTHHNILNNAYFAAKEMHFTEQDRLAVPLPFYHCFGMVLANLLCLSVGACVVIPSEHFDAGHLLHAIDAEKCTALHGVPTMFINLFETPDFKTYNLSSMRTGIMAGAPCPPELMQRVMHEMHCSEILIGYGQTEASPLTHLTER